MLDYNSHLLGGQGGRSGETFGHGNVFHTTEEYWPNTASKSPAFQLKRPPESPQNGWLLLLQEKPVLPTLPSGLHNRPALKVATGGLQGPPSLAQPRAVSMKRSSPSGFPFLHAGPPGN